MLDIGPLLRTVPVFEELDDRELDQVADVCRPASFQPGEYVFREGETGSHLYIILEGEVRISRTVPGSGEEALAVLKVGALFGEMAVFERRDRSTDAIAMGTTRLLTISRADFERLMDLDRDLAYKVLWALVRLLSLRLRSTNDSLRSFLAMSMF
jgi:CRP/FNR family transcriptional regulator, cyclic AMP receptor protein